MAKSRNLRGSRIVIPRPSAQFLELGINLYITHSILNLKIYSSCPWRRLSQQFCLPFFFFDAFRTLGIICRPTNMFSKTDFNQQYSPISSSPITVFAVFNKDLSTNLLFTMFLCFRFKRTFKKNIFEDKINPAYGRHRNS